MSMNQRDAQAITYLAMRLREETKGASRWDEHGVYTVVSRFIGQHLATSLEQVARHAGDHEAKTPGAINRPFLPEPSTPPKRVGPPKKPDECRTHVGQYADNCGGCRADALAATYDDEETTMTDLDPTLAGAELARAAMGTSSDSTHQEA